MKKIEVSENQACQQVKLALQITKTDARSAGIVALGLFYQNV